MPHDTITIDPDDGITTVISVFHTTPERQPALLDILTTNAHDWLRHLDGFIAAGLHPSLDGTTIVNYAQWRDADAVAEMLKDPEAQRHRAQVAKLATVTPIRCTVSSVRQPTGNESNRAGQDSKP